MTTKNQQVAQRVHTHRGEDFACVPGSRRERVLLDLFAAEDRLAYPVEAEAEGLYDTGGIFPVIVISLATFVVGLAAGWLI